MPFQRLPFNPHLRDEAAVTATQGQFQHLDFSWFSNRCQTVGRWSFDFRTVTVTPLFCFWRSSEAHPFFSTCFLTNHDCQRKTASIDTQHPFICEKMLPSSYTWFFFGIFLLDSLTENHHSLRSSLQFCIGSHQPDRPEVHHPKGAAWILRSPVHGHSKHHPFSTNFWKGEDTKRLTSSLFFQRNS